MKPIYSFIFFVLVGFQFAFASGPVVLETKIIDKTFEVNPSAELKISNKYGNVNMTTWDKNTIEFHIEIKVDGKNADRVRERINAISVEFNATKNLVSAETIFKKTGNTENTNITIHYFVKLPKNNNINIRNMYGNIAIDNLKGTSFIDLKYGNFTAENLYNAINLHEYKYVTNASIEFVKSATFNMDYSKLAVEKSELLNLNSDYTDISIGKVHDLINNLEYGNLTIQEGAAISTVSEYANLKIGTVHQSFVSSGSYGSISIGSVPKGFNKISIGLDYGDVSIGMDPGAGYTFTGNFKYGGLKYPSNIDFSKIIQKTVVNSYEGKAGNGSGEILLNMNYGSAKIKLN